MSVLHALNCFLNIFLVKDIFQQLHHLGDVQLLDLRCDAFQSSCDGAKSVSAAFALAVLVLLDAVFQTLDSVVKLFDLLFVLLFFRLELFKFGVRCVFHRTSFVCWCFQPCGYGMI